MVSAPRRWDPRQRRDAGRGLAVRAKVIDLEKTNSGLSGRVSTLRDKVTALEAKLSKVSYHADGLNGRPTLKISGANLQIVNGTPTRRG